MYINSKKTQLIFITWLLCKDVDIIRINWSTESSMPRYRYSIFRVSKYSVASPDRRRNSKGGGWRRTKLVRRTRNGSSPYFCDSSRPVHPSVADRIIDRWMDGWERGKGLVQRPCPFVPQSPFLSFSFLASLHHPSRRPLLILSLSHSPVKTSPAFFLFPASVTCFSAPVDFRYLIKSSYDEKRKKILESGRSVVVPPFPWATKAIMLSRARKTGEW